MVDGRRKDSRVAFDYCARKVASQKTDADISQLNSNGI
jgi:hypothetical protein